MDYRIEEIKIGDSPETYFIPYKQSSYGFWETFPQLKGSYCKTYEEALSVIKNNHIVVVKSTIVNLP